MQSQPIYDSELSHYEAGFNKEIKGGQSFDVYSDYHQTQLSEGPLIQQNSEFHCKSLNNKIERVAIIFEILAK